MAFLVTSAVFLIVLGAFSADINKGYTFTPTDHVTSTKLNNLLDLSTIAPSFISGQTALTTPQLADSLVMYSVSADSLRKVTTENLAGQVFGFTHTDWRSNFLAGADETTRSNFLCLASLATMTNLLARELAMAASNYPPAVVNSGLITNYAPVYSPTSSVPAVVKFPQFFTTNFPLGFSINTNLPHGFGGVPQDVRWVLQCQVNEAGSGRMAGDEVSVSGVFAQFTNNPTTGVASSFPAFLTGASSSNVFLTSRTNGGSGVFSFYAAWGTNSGTSIITNANWRLKCTATFWP